MNYLIYLKDMKLENISNISRKRCTFSNRICNKMQKMISLFRRQQLKFYRLPINVIKYLDDALTLFIIELISTYQFVYVSIV